MARTAVSRPFRTLPILALGIAVPLCALTSVAQESSSAAAMALEQQGRTSQATEAWRSITASDPANAQAFAHLGLLLSRQQRYPEAIESYGKAIAIAPEMPGLQMNLGLAYFKAGQFPSAIKIFSAQLNKHPDATQATHLDVLLGMAHFGMADYFVAIPYLERAASTEPSSLPLRLTLAHSCLWSKQYDCVLRVYKEILALDADSAEADMIAGEALDEMGNDAGAIEQFRSATKANPRELNAHFGLGYLLWKQQHFDEAATEFAAELNLDPSRQQARIYFADSLVEVNQFEKAAPALKQILASDPSIASAMVHRDLGIVLAETGHTAEALIELQKAIQLDPTYVSAHWRLAKAYQATGDKAKARAEFDLVSAMKRESSRPLTQELGSNGIPNSSPQ